MAGFAEYQNYDALGLAELIRAKEVTPGEVLEAAIARVEAINPAINAVVNKMYDEAEQTIAAGLPDGPFTGVPYMLKDLGYYYAGVATSAGSRLFAEYVPDHDSTITERTRAAGLVIMGKTNTPELGLAGTTESQLFGPTRNPWNLERSAGGSSGGATAAVASRMLPMAHATDGGGSIRIPCANCGVFGLKPTRARYPVGPDVGEGMSGLSVGHCGSRSVRDSAALLDATHGPSPGDPYIAPPPGRPFLEEVGADPGQLRIAVMTKTHAGAAIDPECVKAIGDAAKLCSDLGHVVEDAAPEVDDAEMRHVWRIIIGANVYNMVHARARALGRDLQQGDLERVPYAWVEEAANYTGADYALAIQTMHRIGRQMAGFFENYDVLLSTTMAKPPIPLGAMDMMNADLDDYYERQLMDEIPFTPLFNESGGPAMSVPLFWSGDGLPIGIHFGTRFGDDAALFRLASQLEAARPWADRRPPEPG